MKGTVAICMLAAISTMPSICVAETPLRVSSQQAANEALSNRVLANTLWEATHKACAAKNISALFDVMHAVNAQSKAQPVDHKNYSARLEYSGCQQMLSDVSFINGACLNKTPTKHEYDYVNRNWSADSKLCDADIAKPVSTSTNAPVEQTDAEWEAEQRKDGASDDDIKLMKQIRSS